MTDPRPPQDVDGLARRLPRREPSAERSAAMRHALLDAAQPPEVEPARSALRSWWIGTAAAAAAVVCAWLVLRGPNEPAPSATDVASAPSSASPSAAAAPGAASPAAGATTGAAGAPVAPGGPQIASSGAAPGAGSAAPGAGSAAASADSAAPTAIAADDRIPDGLTTFAPTHPVQMTRGTSTITAPPEARFDVEVRGDEVKRVTVMAGWVVVASARAKTTIVPTRYTWTPEAPVPTPLPPPATPTPASPASPSPAAAASSSPPTAVTAAANPAPSTTRTAPSTATTAASTSPGPRADTASPTKTAAPADTAPPPPAATPSPLEAPPQAPGGSERDFRDGLRSLLAGDPRSATAPLARACVAPSSSQDDMCYWAAVAWLRSGDNDRARQAFSDMLGRWPGSTHVGEANVALGWLLLEAGDRSGARTRFAAAANDRMASIRANAVRGLAASQ